MRKHITITGTAAILFIAACADVPTVAVEQKQIDLRPGFSGVFGGSGNAIARESSNTENTTATGTEFAAADSTSNGRGGFGAGSGN